MPLPNRHYAEIISSVIKYGLQVFTLASLLVNCGCGAISDSPIPPASSTPTAIALITSDGLQMPENQDREAIAAQLISNPLIIAENQDQGLDLSSQIVNYWLENAVHPDDWPSALTALQNPAENSFLYPNVDTQEGEPTEFPGFSVAPDTRVTTNTGEENVVSVDGIVLVVDPEGRVVSFHVTAPETGHKTPVSLAQMGIPTDMATGYNVVEIPIRAQLESGAIVPVFGLQNRYPLISPVIRDKHGRLTTRERVITGLGGLGKQEKAETSPSPLPETLPDTPTVSPPKEPPAHSSPESETTPPAIVYDGELAPVNPKLGTIVSDMISRGSISNNDPYAEAALRYWLFQVNRSYDAESIYNTIVSENGGFPISMNIATKEGNLRDRPAFTINQGTTINGLNVERVTGFFLLVNQEGNVVGVFNTQQLPDSHTMSDFNGMGITPQNAGQFRVVGVVTHVHASGGHTFPVLSFHENGDSLTSTIRINGTELRIPERVITGFGTVNIPSDSAPPAEPTIPAPEEPEQDLENSDQDQILSCMYALHRSGSVCSYEHEDIHGERIVALTKSEVVKINEIITQEWIESGKYPDNLIVPNIITGRKTDPNAGYSGLFSNFVYSPQLNYITIHVPTGLDIFSPDGEYTVRRIFVHELFHALKASGRFEDDFESWPDNDACLPGYSCSVRDKGESVFEEEVQAEIFTFLLLSPESAEWVLEQGKNNNQLEQKIQYMREILIKYGFSIPH
ncbi:MAG: hypothetical protein ACOCXT_04900 [Candidatus Dojkabacteria bacterium]